MSGFNFRKSGELDGRSSSDGYDAVDKPPDSCRVSSFALASFLFSILFHFLDLGCDFWLAHSYASKGKYAHFICTLAFILASSIIINSVSVTMYLADCRKSGNPRHALVRIILCFLGIPVQSAIIIRYFDCLWYAKKSSRAEAQSCIKQQQKYFYKMLNEESDAALLRIFECYLESAPQLILQTTLLIKDYFQGSVENQTFQVVSIILGFMALGLSMANYQRCIRFDQEDKENISNVGFAVQFFWHINFTASRILTVASVAILYTFWTCMVVVVHWSAVTVWLALSSKTKFCGKNRTLEILFYGVIGMVYIFNFLNLNEGPTRQSYLIFYLFCFVENVIAATIWGVNSVSMTKNWIYYIFVILPIFCFLLGVAFLIVYYKFVHPNRGKDRKSGENQI